MTTENDTLPIERLSASIQLFMQFLETSPYYNHRRGDPSIADFVFGNPHEMPLAGFVEAIGKRVAPQSKDWFAYKMSEPGSREVVAASLRRRTGLPYGPEHVFMTNGAFAALAVTLRAILAPGDEVIYLSPPWFYYEFLVEAGFGKAVRVDLPEPSFDLPVEAIAAQITPRTRAVIVNSPHNPTGRVYPRASLEALAEVLRAASLKHGQPIFIVSDEAYNRIVYSGVTFTSPAEAYDETIVCYTYGKTLLTPGERVGYIAATPASSRVAALRRAIPLAQFANGWSFPNAILQHSLAELEGLCIDIGALERRRDRLAAALSEMGYELCVPEGTFYMTVRSPMPDDMAFSDLLGKLDTFVLPGCLMERPGWFRISFTANDEMVEKGIGAFREAIEMVRERRGT